MQRRPPTGRLRQSQMLRTYGAGAMVDLIDHAVLIGGLDYWRLKEGGVPVEEPRLRANLAERLARLDPPLLLSIDRPFLAPPAGDEQDAHESVGVQVLEFPGWFVCSNTKCRALVGIGSLDLERERRVHHCSGAERTSSPCSPVRFVASCARGHLADVEWPYWLHGGKCPSGAPNLRLEEGPSGDFSEIGVRCTSCDQHRWLKDLTVEEKALDCKGRRPWLGPEGDEKECDKKQHMLVRTASNQYFGQVESAVSIPSVPSIRGRVESVYSTFEAAERSDVPVLRKIPKVKQVLLKATDEEIWAAIVAIREKAPEASTPLKLAEYQTFVAQPVEVPGEIPGDSEEEKKFYAREHKPPDGLLVGIARLVLARRLREVQVALRFTRLEPSVVSVSGELDLGVQSARLSLMKDWLPAVEIRGKGFFVQLDEERVRAWEGDAAVIERENLLKAGYEKWAADLDKPPGFPGARFYLLHSLSHVLLTQLSLECGYPASSIKERLYCAPATAAVPMAAILLSTGTTGAEGTLGGLVEEGRALDRHLAKALDDTRLCSNDPVCAHHVPTDASRRCLEGAACHGCLYLPETSCEFFNQSLDRALVVPVLGVEGAAFFKP